MGSIGENVRGRDLLSSTDAGENVKVYTEPFVISVAAS